MRNHLPTLHALTERVRNSLADGGSPVVLMTRADVGHIVRELERAEQLQELRATAREPLRRGLQGNEHMDLPTGRTCSDCVHFRRCHAMFGHVAADEVCDWDPSRYHRTGEHPGPFKPVQIVRDQPQRVPA